MVQTIGNKAKAMVMEVAEMAMMTVVVMVIAVMATAEEGGCQL